MIDFSEKNEKICFRQKPEAFILLNGNFDSTKSTLQTCLTSGGRMVSVSNFSSEKNQLQFGKKKKKTQKIFFITSLAQKTPERGYISLVKLTES